MQLWIVPLRLPPPSVAACLELLDAAERERADRLHADSLRSAFIAAHGALRRLLGAALAHPPASLRFEPGPWGKPALAAARAAGLHFNLSHADDTALIALTRRAPVGVDIERLPVRADVGQDLPGILSNDERAALLALPAAQRPRAALRCWVRKEALLKGAGCGITQGLDNFSVSCGPAARLLASRHPALAMGAWSLRALESPGRWTAAVALQGCLPRALAVRCFQWPPGADNRAVTCPQP